MYLNVIFLDTGSGFGYNFSATNTKTEFMARGLVEQGANVTVINSVIGCKCVDKKEIIDYPLVGKVITYPKNGNQLVSWTKNVKNLKYDLRKLYHPNEKNIVILESPDYHIYRLYCHYAHKYGYKIAVISHEWLPTISTIHPLRKPSAWLYTRNFGNYADVILPISEYIIKKISHFNKSYFKVPVLAEFKGVPVKKDKSNYFLYCVYAAYSRVILPLINAFIVYQQQENDGHQLVLVLSGTCDQIKPIVEYVKIKDSKNTIIIMQKLSYEELVQLYENALGLIIPLDPNSEQDCARFSQKIAEYTSSATPIISCKVGEVANYFEDRLSAVFCDYDPQSFVEAFKWIVDNPNKATNIGIKGYEVGIRYFNYRKVDKDLYDFFLQL